MLHNKNIQKLLVKKNTRIKMIDNYSQLTLWSFLLLKIINIENKE